MVVPMFCARFIWASKRTACNYYRRYLIWKTLSNILQCRWGMKTKCEKNNFRNWILIYTHFHFFIVTYLSRVRDTKFQLTSFPALALIVAEMQIMSFFLFAGSTLPTAHASTGSYTMFNNLFVDLFFGFLEKTLVARKRCESPKV